MSELLCPVNSRYNCTQCLWYHRDSKDCAINLIADLAVRIKKDKERSDTKLFEDGEIEEIMKKCRSSSRQK